MRSISIEPLLKLPGVSRYPGEGVACAGNVRAMFRPILAAGCDVDTRGNIRSGWLLIERMTVAGN